MTERLPKSRIRPEGGPPTEQNSGGSGAPAANLQASPPHSGYPAPPAPRRLLATALAISATLQHSLLWAAPALPAGTLPVPAAAWVASGAASRAVSGANMTITQQSQRAVLDWQSFNLSADAKVRFDQPNATAAALNRIHDANPSVIQGQLSANGEVYLINANGILFDQGARVNVGGLVASTLGIDSDTFLAGLLSVPNGEAAFKLQSGAPVDGLVQVAPGARLAATTNGRVLLLAPQVENNGEISTPDGQTILAAGQKAYLMAPTDASLRGFLVEVDGGGSVTNGVGGTIGAARGNVTLVGRDVNQNGRVSATSAVGRNGSIRLLARDNVVTATENGVPVVQATRTGALVLGEGSVTEVVPERDSAATSRDDVAFDKSTVELVGRTVHLKQDAAVLAAGGVVDITAQDGQFFETATQARQSDVRVQMDAGARIDVAGLRDVDVPVERNVLQIELRGDELKDAPLQRQGVLRNKTVFVDAREGTSLLDISPFLGQVERSVAERSASGGEIRIRSEGDVVLRAGASLDVSGGSIRFRDGVINTTQLISDRGVVDISDASPEVSYRGIAGIYEVTDPKWGVTRRYQTLPGTVVQGYLEGKDAGTVSILGHRLVLDADLRGKVVVGPLQVDTDTLPRGGRLVLGNASQVSASNPDFLLPDLRLAARAPVLPTDFTFMTDGSPTPLPPDWEDRLTLDPQRLVAGGFEHLEVYSNGRIDVDTPLSLPAGGSLRLAGREVEVRQDITLPAGSIGLSSHDTFARTPDEEAARNDAQRHAVRVADGVSLRARGLWSNAALDPVFRGPILPDGGSVTLSSVADLILGAGSLIDVTGGGHVREGGQLEGGTGGSIGLSVGGFGTFGVADEQTSELRLGSSLLGYGIAGGGSLTLNASRVQIGGAAPDQARVLHLDAGFFERGGFGAYSVTGRDGLTVVADTRLNPRQQNLLPAADVSLAPMGSDVMQLTEVGLQPLPLRAPTHLSLNTGSTLFGALTVEAGARIELDPQGRLSLRSADRLVVAGELRAPAGTITLATTRAGSNDSFDASEGVWLTPTARLSATGYAALSPDQLGRQRGEVLAGGEIVIDAARGYLIAERGAVLDVSATAAEMDIVSPDGFTSRQRIAGAAGSIQLTAREGMAMDATLRGFGAGAGGGSLGVAIARPPAGLTFPSAPVTLALHSEAGFVPAGLQPGDIVPGSLNGIAHLAADTVAAGGFDNLSLRSERVLQFADDVTLSLAGQLQLNAVNFTAAPGSTTHLAGSLVTLGNDDPTQQPPTSPVAGDASLTVDGQLIDLVGSSALGGFDRVTLNSRGDIRLRGVVSVSGALGQPPRGVLTSAADLALTAAQIYPTTLSDYTVRVQGRPGGRIEVRPNGTAGDTPLSAGGRLTLDAPVIHQAGTLRAPFGQLTLAGESVTLADGSLTAVSGGGRLIPFGAIELSGRDYVYVLSDDNRLVFDSAPQKRVALDGESVDVAPGAVIDLNGGGDLVAFEFTPGPGGSRDVLSAAVPDGFAVLPDLRSEVAPYDEQSYRGADLGAGDMIYLAGGAGLAAGWYPLLPARYALLPGAFWVRPMAGFADVRPGAVSPLADGGVVMAGARGQWRGSAAPVREARWSGYAVRPGDVTRLYSEYSQARASSFFPADAAQRTVDAGQLSVQAGNSLRLAGSLLGAAGPGGRGAEVDIAAARIAVLGGSGAAPGDDFVTLDAGQLTGLGAASLMIGGLRSASADRVDLTVSASDVWVDTDGVALAAPQILLAATDRVTVRAGSRLTAKGKAPVQTAQPLHVADAGGDGDGALLGVSAGPHPGLVRDNFDRSRGDLNVQAGVLLEADGSIVLDATRAAAVDGELRIAEGGELAIAAGAVSLGEVPAGTPGLVLDTARLASLGGLGALTVRSYSTLDLYGGVSVGGAGLGRMNIETGSLRGFVGAGQTALLQADRLSIGNPSAGTGVDAVTNTGTLRLVASDLLLGDGGVDGGGNTVGTAVSGVERLEVRAARELRLSGRGALSTTGALDIQAGVITADTGAEHRITSAGALTTAALAPPAAAVKAGLGARLALQGSDVTHGAWLHLPSGHVELTATAGDLRLIGGGVVDVSGSVLTIGESRALAPGGHVSVAAIDGDVLLDAGSRVDVSAPAQASAGALDIAARQGTAVLNGELRGGAWQDDGLAQGRFSLDVQTLADFAAVNAALAPQRDASGQLRSGGFSDQRLIRVRSGDVAVTPAVNIRARRFELAADAGSITFDGTVDASGEQGGRIVLAAGQDLTLGSAARLLARGEADNALGYGTAGRGGEVVLMVSADGTGRIDTQAGSLIDVSASASADPALAGGRVQLRAPRIGNDVAIGRLDGTVVGAREVVAEAVRVYDDINTLRTSGSGAGVLLLSTIQADNDAYLSAANKAAMLSRLGRSGDAGFHLRPGVEVRSDGDLTLAAAWDLFPLRHQGEPGVLTLRAAGDLRVNASLSDAVRNTGGFLGFDQLQSGESWSYRLVAGADTGAASPLGTVSGSGDLAFSAGARVRTGTGFVDLAAGGDLRFADAGSVATLGRPDTTVADFTIPNVGRNPAVFPIGGGDIRLDIGGDLVAAAPDQLITGWLYRQGSLSGNGTLGSGIDSRTAWWIRFVDFRQGIGALGGGNIEARIGGDAVNPGFSVPTTGRLEGPNGSVPDPQRLVVRGGGDLNLAVGGDVLSGVFHLGGGQGRLTVGGELGSARTVTVAGQQRPVYSQFGLGAGQWDVQVGRAAHVGGVFTPTLLPLVTTNSRSSYFSTYAPESAFRVASVAGNLALENDSAVIGAAFPPLLAGDPGNDNATDAVTLNPPSVIATALSGDLDLPEGLRLFPAAEGGFDLFAGGSLTVGDSLLVPDVAPGRLPGPLRPSSVYGVINTELRRSATQSFDHSNPPLHLGDAQPLRIAAGGTIRGPQQGVALFAPKPLRLYALGDVENFWLFGQNLADTDVTRLSAGGDIRFTTARGAGGSLLTSTAGFEIGGPGRLEVLAGGDIDLGASKGIVSRGNLNNPFLADQGAAVLAMAGLAQAPDYVGFASRYLDPEQAVTTTYQELLLAYVQSLGGPVTTPSQAWAQFQTLAPELRSPLLHDVFFAELRAAGRQAVAEGGDDPARYRRGFDAIATLFPGAGEEGSPYRGDINLFFSQIRTEQDGGIDLFAPGGLINAGLANPGGFNKSASELGIVTVRGGSVRAFTDGDFLVNQSRVFTLGGGDKRPRCRRYPLLCGGGDILLWSSRGNIDAGRGAKTAAATPPPVVRVVGDQFVLDTSRSISGSGIGVLLSSPDIVPGDVDLIAPNGEVNAGDAGIRSAGNLTIAAPRVVGADNIQVGGVSSGVPVTSTAVSGSVASAASSSTAAAIEAGADPTKLLPATAAGPPDSGLGTVVVDVLGFEDGRENDG